MTTAASKKPARKLRLTISAKLIGLIALLLVASIATIVSQSTKMYVNNDHGNIQLVNSESVTALSNQTRDIFSNLVEKMRFSGTILLQDPSAASINPLIQDFFESDKDFVGIFIHKVENGEWTRVGQVFSPEFVESGDVDGTRELTMLKVDKGFSLEKLLKGEPQIVPMKVIEGMPLIAVGIQLNSHYTGIAFIKPSKLSGIFSEYTSGVSYLVDHKGNVLSHTDASHVGDNFSQLPVVKELLSGTLSNNNVTYTDPASGESRIASYRIVGFGGLGVVSELPEGLAFQAAHEMAKRATHLGLAILFIAFWAGYIYSSTLTRPISRLVEAAQKIASGDFKINLRFRGQDEIAHLSNAFNEMAKGLEERDRVKDTFNKFHNKEIAEKLLSGEVKLGGERKEATIFFSDVRGFTAMSETMQPEEVVEMLNEYMTRMVSVIRGHHGIVDKYIGDAIMGLWGVPIGTDDDLYNAMRACLQMREELAKLNTLRISRGQSALKIGMGLNVGPVIAGNIGSVEKMEYTVIGDTVNLASRMESMTKEYGTDLLIPKAIHDRLKDRFIFEKCKSAKVKGKSAEIEIYKVKGYVDAAGNGIVIETPYSTYESEKSDKVVHDSESKNQTDITHEVVHPEAAAEPKYYFVEMYGEVMGPFSPAEFKSGIASQDFPKEAFYSNSKTGIFRSIADFGLMTIAVGEKANFVNIPDLNHPSQVPPQAAAPSVAPPAVAPPTEVPVVQQEAPIFVLIDTPLAPETKIITPPPFREKVETSAAETPVTEVAPQFVLETPTAVPAFAPPGAPAANAPSAPPVSFEPPSTPPPSFEPPRFAGPTFPAPSSPPPTSPPPSFAPPIFNGPTFAAPTTPPPSVPPIAPPAPAVATAEEVAPPAFPSTDVVNENGSAIEIEMPTLEEKRTA